MEKERKRGDFRMEAGRGKTSWKTEEDMEGGCDRGHTTKKQEDRGSEREPNILRVEISGEDRG